MSVTTARCYSAQLSRHLNNLENGEIIAQVLLAWLVEHQQQLKPAATQPIIEAVPVQDFAQPEPLPQLQLA